MISFSRFEQIISNYSKGSILVIGDLMLDQYIIGDSKRLSPEAPVPVVNVKEQYSTLGGAANVIHNLNSLGCKTIAIGIIGDDEDGKLLVNELQKKIVNTNGIVIDKTRPTIVKRRVVANKQQIVRLDWEITKEISNEIEDLLFAKFLSLINQIKAVILSDYDKGLLTENLVKRVINECNQQKIICVVDPKPKNAFRYKNATSLTPNKKEAYECVGKEKVSGLDPDFYEIGINLKKTLCLNNLLITRSHEGMTLFNTDVKDIPTVATEVFDVSGAGDTVISAYTLSYISGSTWEEAAHIANIAAGIVVGKFGTAVTTVDEMKKFYLTTYMTNGVSR